MGSVTFWRLGGQTCGVSRTSLPVQAMKRDLLTSSCFWPCATLDLRDTIPNPAFFIRLSAVSSTFKHSRDCICSTCPVKNDFIWRSLTNYMCKYYLKKKHCILKFDVDMNGGGCFLSHCVTIPHHPCPLSS